MFFWGGLLGNRHARQNNRQDRRSDRQENRIERTLDRADRRVDRTLDRADNRIDMIDSRLSEDEVGGNFVCFCLFFKRNYFYFKIYSSKSLHVGKVALTLKEAFFFVFQMFFFFSIACCVFFQEKANLLVEAWKKYCSLYAAFWWLVLLDITLVNEILEAVNTSFYNKNRWRYPLQIN